MALDKVLGWFNIVYVRYFLWLKAACIFFPEDIALLWINIHNICIFMCYVFLYVSETSWIRG